MASEPTRDAVEILTSARDLVVSDIRSAVDDHVEPSTEWSTAIVRLSHAIAYMRLTDYGGDLWTDWPSDPPGIPGKRS